MTSFFDSPSRRRRVTYDFVRSSVRMRETTTTCSAALACRKTLYGRNPRTYTSYEHVVHAHLVAGLGRVRVAKLTPQDVAAWLSRHQANGASGRTARYARAVLRAALNQALRWELVARNAAALTDPPRHRTREIQPLTPDQAKALLAAVAGHRLEALVSVGIGLGLRLGEALGLRWDAVDLEAGVLSVKQTLERAGGDAVARCRLTAERRRLLDELGAARALADQPDTEHLRACRPRAPAGGGGQDARNPHALNRPSDDRDRTDQESVRPG